MIFRETDIEGVIVVEPQPSYDERGYFARVFCEEAFAERGLVSRFVQHSLSYSIRVGTLRGMHFQRAPHGETKLVTCLAGRTRNVVVDLRPRSPTYLRWQGFDLDPKSRRRLYIPEGCAQGFQTLADDTEVFYLISARYEPTAATGVRHDDPAFAIRWPLPVSVISDRDRTWPDYEAPR